MKVKRIVVWGVCLVISIILISFNKHKDDLPKVQKRISIYNDVEKEGIVRQVLVNANLVSKNKVTFVQKSNNANQVADYVFTKDVKVLKDDDNKVTLTSYTPLVIVLKNSDNLLKYQDSGLIISSKEINNSIEDELSIDFKKLIDAVVKGENWSTFGGKEKEFKIIIPCKDSIEGKIFYSFLLTTINGGSYPQTDEAIKETKIIADSFWESSSCVESEDVINDMSKISLVNETDLYVLFEADLMNSTVWSQNKIDMSIVYPTTTVVKHIYMQSEEDCEELFDLLSTQLNYRNSNIHSFTKDKNYNVKDEIEFVEVPVVDFSVNTNNGFKEAMIVVIVMIVIIVAGLVVIAIIDS